MRFEFILLSVRKDFLSYFEDVFMIFYLVWKNLWFKCQIYKLIFKFIGMFGVFYVCFIFDIRFFVSLQKDSSLRVFIVIFVYMFSNIVYFLYSSLFFLKKKKLYFNLM